MNQKTNSCHYLIIAVVILLIPLLYIYQTAHTINPFYLTGKRFLPFFCLLTATSFFTAFAGVLVLQKQETSKNITAVKPRLLQPELCIVFVLIIGFARLVQGISNHKPVGYLLLLMLLNFGLLLVIKALPKTE